MPLFAFVFAAVVPVVVPVVLLRFTDLGFTFCELVPNVDRELVVLGCMLVRDALVSESYLNPPAALALMAAVFTVVALRPRTCACRLWLVS